MSLERDGTSESKTGFVLPAVLLAILALTIVIAAIIAAAKRSNDVHILNQSQLSGKLKLESALSVVTSGLIDQPQIWVPKQAPYRLTIGQDRFDVRLQASGGLIDINTMQPADLARFFLLAGASQEQATSLGDKIADWRDGDSLVRGAGAERPDYRAAGLQRPRDSWFTRTDELGFVMGFSRELSDCLAPFVTVDSSLPQIVGPYAPPALASLSPTISAGPPPALTEGSSVEIEITNSDAGKKQVLTAVVRTTGRADQPILIHALQMQARPNREEVPTCFKGER
jgi:type II secretory pathway component PulK